ncbi:helicase-associated domain-containing protein [Streptomyces iconiensis]|uniref:Helicase-associated domain-containing protein n=1 Tax=Streptomyces iconiensis TaxID=1384038 RepID=A0ABT7A8A7_9ACTN|nr:helicase-associated domain-containing protein [Streptomyces iconiensis]MDJ1137530.1 helicase-associated domain-containing protein [Streptomyces iconiensis]
MSSEQNGDRPQRQDTRPPGPRTLAEDLRERDDGALAALLRTRPDLLSPVPNDLTQLATRAGTRTSVARALEGLDQFTLQVAQALAVTPGPPGSGASPSASASASPASASFPPPSPSAAQGPPDGITVRDALAGLLPGEEAAERLPHALAELRARALVWGEEEYPRLVRTARELLTSHSPTGLGPTLAEAAGAVRLSPARLQEMLAAAGLPATHDPVSALAALSALFTDPDRMGTLLAGAPEGTEAVLRRLEWGPPFGTVDAEAPSPPVAWLLDRALLVPTGPATSDASGAPGNVVLPREVALYLRGGRAHRVLEPVAPRVVPARTYGAADVDAAAAGQALAALAAVEELLTLWETEPPPVLRAGGLGVRDLKRAATALDVSEPMAAFWIELAYVAGLLASDGEADERFAPTPAYDDWLRLPPADRWARLASAWLPATRVPGLVGARDTKGRGYSPLGPGLDRGLAPGVRRRALVLLAGLDPGAAPDRDSVLERLRWERPLQGNRDAHGDDGPTALRGQLAHWALDEADALGLTGRGALASHARPLLEDAARGQAAKALAPHLPEPLSEVLLQADLTAVAPGPLERELSAFLGVLADIESKGGATVYRFSPDSVRRALDAGRTASDLHAFLATHSSTPVPQPLTYLIDDVARKHGRLRVGAASSYVRCDDDALLNEILADRRAAPLRLRLLAPTLLASPAPPDQLLARLREMGYAPAAESAEGDVVLTRPDAHRTPPRTAPDPLLGAPAGMPGPGGNPPQPDATMLGAAVRAIRAGDHAATLSHKPKAPAFTPPASPHHKGLPRTVMAETLATVQSATLSGTPLWIGYVNADGAASQRVIAPVKVEGGFVTAYDHTADEVRTYPLHRITGAAEVAED